MVGLGREPGGGGGGGTIRARTIIGTVDVNAATAKFRLAQTADEIISLLASDPQATVEVTVEINAEFPQGASDHIRRHPRKRHPTRLEEQDLGIAWRAHSMNGDHGLEDAMGEHNDARELAPQTADYVASAARAALGAVPFAGSLLTELAGIVIPNQRIERIVRYALELETRLTAVEHQFVRSQLGDDEFTDLMEESLHQAARSLSQERRSHIASVVANSLTDHAISYAESKHLLRLLGELNDVEVIRLGWHQYTTIGSGEDYYERHEAVLRKVRATILSSQDEVDDETLQRSYDQHLARLGLLEPHYRTDLNTKLPVYDARTGVPELQRYEITRLGLMLLREAAVQDDSQPQA